MSTDPRFAAFVSRNTPDVFRSVLGADDVWRADPMDVPEIHAETRRLFDTVIDALVDRSPSEEPVSIARRTLVVCGDAGTGKTHLMRALRSRLHETARGFFAYMQLSVHVDDYPRYVLFNLLESLSQPYNVAFSDQSGLEHISRSLLDEARQQNVPGAEQGDDGEIDGELVAEGMQQMPAFRNVEPGVLTALLLLQRKDPVVTKRAIKYLRCEPLTERESKVLGGLHALTAPEAPARVVRWLADIVRMTYQRPLVICIDQLDAFYVGVETAGPAFRSAMAALLDLTEHPNIVVIVSALENYYTLLSASLTGSQRDRLEGGHPPSKLKTATSPEQVGALLAKRLAFLYESAEAPWDPAQPYFPFADDADRRLAGPQIRVALMAASEAREHSIRTGHMPTIGADIASRTHETEGEARALDLDESWNDFRYQSAGEAPETVAGIAALVRHGIELGARELPPTRRAAGELRGERLELSLERSGGPSERALVGILNQKPQFGNLAKAAAKLETEAASDGIPPVLLRNDAFPRTPRTKITSVLGEIVARGGRLVTFADSELRTVASFVRYDEKYRSLPSYAEWLRRSKPLTSLPGMVALLRLDGVEGTQIPLPVPAIEAREPERTRAAETTPQPPEPTPPRQAPAPVPVTTATAPFAVPGRIDLGARSNGTGRFEIDPHVLTRHTAIFGGAGSGKTTLAFSLLENALLRGTPAILIDRKGDLVSFADETAWQRPLDADAATRRSALRERLDVVVYTPGSNNGRNLTIPTIPSGFDDLREDERQDEARAAAAGIASLLNWGTAQNNKQAVLAQAIGALISVAGEAKPTLKMLVDFIDEKDPALMAAIGKLDPRLLNKVVQDLETMRLNAGNLVDASGEAIDIAALLGAHSAPGKTRLSIISTKFLGDERSQLFWVSRLLADLGRYASRHPKPTLQALVFFDEADVYLPATSKPPTKLPMENLFKRARSAGIGMVLATQSPGDLDYKSKENVTTWLIGRVNQPQAIKKLEDVFGPTGSGSLAKIPNLTVGNFFGISEKQGPVAFVADRPAIEPVQLDESQILAIAADGNALP